MSTQDKKPGNFEAGSPVPILNLPIGQLNDVISDDVGAQSIDFNSETAMSVIARSTVKAFTPNKLANSGILFGVMLREEIPPATGEKILSGLDKALEVAGSAPLELKKYRVMIPEYHVGRPVPTNLTTPTDFDNKIIDLYPIFEAYDTAVGLETVKPGDLVKVMFNNTGTRSRGFYLGPVKTDRASLGAGGNPSGQNIANGFNCGSGNQTSGAPGDGTLSSPTTFPASPTATGPWSAPVITEGQGHGKIELIQGPNAQKWLAKGLEKYQQKGSYQGLLYVGRLASNGATDDVNMKEGAGRGTWIYMPAICNPNQPIELIYWFHGIRGFTSNDYGNRLKKASKSWEKAKRNFILVQHECLWSKENAAKKTGVQRQKTDRGARGWTDRQWNNYGYQRTSENATGLWGPPAGITKPANFVEGRYPDYITPKWPNAIPAGGNFYEMHKETMQILQKTFGVKDTSKVQVTVMGHSAGGAAIGGAARMGQLAQVRPNRIVFSDAIYAGSTTNGFADSDIFDVFQYYVKDNPQCLLESHTTNDGSKSPLKNSYAFFGALKKAVDELPNGDYTSIANKMIENVWKNMIYKDLKGDKKIEASIQTKKDSKNRIQSKVLWDYYSIGKKVINNKSEAYVVPLSKFPNLAFKSWLMPTVPPKKKHSAAAVPILQFIPTNVSPPITTDAATPTPSDATKADSSQSPNPPPQVEKKSTTTPPTKEGASPGNFAGEKVTKLQKGRSSYVKMLQNYPGKSIVYKSQYNRGGDVIIYLPDGSDPTNAYELIHYFHGDGGSASVIKKFPDIAKGMVEASKRNIIIVTVSLGSNPKNRKAWVGKPDNNFDQYNKEVIDNIVNVWKGGIPSLINIKAHSAGGAAINNLSKKITDATAKTITRLDYLDASFGGYMRRSVERFKPRMEAGTFEIIVWSSISDGRTKKEAEKYKDTKGVFVKMVKEGHGSVPYKYFYAPSEIGNKTSGTAPAASGNAADTPSSVEGSSPPAGIPSDPNITNQTPGAGPVSSGGQCVDTIRGIGSGGTQQGMTGSPQNNTKGRRSRSSSASKPPPRTSAALAPASGCTQEKYEAHIREQTKAAKQHNSTQPSFDSVAGSHKGKNTIVLGGKEIPCPFKVIRYDGTIPDFKRKIGYWKNYSGKGYTVSGKAWWDFSGEKQIDYSTKSPLKYTAADSKNRRALSKTKGGSDGGKFRKPSQVTHFTIHHAGGSTTSCQPGRGLAQTFASKGWIGHFAIGKDGQIYQVADPLIKASHVGGGGLPGNKTSTNSFSVGLDYLIGVFSGVDKKTMGSGNKNKGAITPPKGTLLLRKYNRTNKWDRPTVINAGTRAMHEATYKLIQWLSKHTGIEHKYCAIDGRLDVAGMLNSNIQSHYQLQGSRVDGMSYIFWCLATEKPGAVRPEWGSPPAAPAAELPEEKK